MKLRRSAAATALAVALIEGLVNTRVPGATVAPVLTTITVAVFIAVTEIKQSDQVLKSSLLMGAIMALATVVWDLAPNIDNAGSAFFLQVVLPVSLAQIPLAVIVALLAQVAKDRLFGSRRDQPAR